LTGTSREHAARNAESSSSSRGAEEAREPGPTYREPIVTLSVADEMVDTRCSWNSEGLEGAGGRWAAVRGKAGKESGAEPVAALRRVEMEPLDMQRREAESSMIAEEEGADWGGRGWGWEGLEQEWG
jgi:hypothetical protein